MIERKAAAWEKEAESQERLEEMSRVVDLVRALPFEIDLWQVQNSYHRIRQGIGPAIGDSEAFRQLGEKLQFGEH
jgi:hypothetical protein